MHWRASGFFVDQISSLYGMVHLYLNYLTVKRIWEKSAVWAPGARVLVWRDLTRSFSCKKKCPSPSSSVPHLTFHDRGNKHFAWLVSFHAAADFTPHRLKPRSLNTSLKFSSAVFVMLSSQIIILHRFRNCRFRNGIH